MNYNNLFTYQPQLASLESGAEHCKKLAEPHLREIVYRYYKSSGMTVEQATHFTSKYFDSLMTYIVRGE